MPRTETRTDEQRNRVKHHASTAAMLTALTLLASASAFAQSGVLDPTFGAGGVTVAGFGPSDELGRAIAIQADDRIVVAGTCNQASDDFCLFRFDLDGALDPALAGTGKVAVPVLSGTDQASAVAVQPDQGIVLAGFSVQGGKDVLAVARLLPSGAPDPGFAGDGTVTTALGTLEDRARAVAVQPADGAIVVAGYSLTASNRDLALARYGSGGTLDPTFSGDGVLVLGVGTGDDEAAALAIQPDGKIVVVGYAADGSQHDLLIARFLDDGTPDPSFNGTGRRRVSFGAGNAFGTAVALQADGKILAAGYARVGTVFHFAVARVDENGLLDPMLDGDGLLTTAIGSTSQANAIAADATGRFVVAGFARIAGNDDMALARYDGAGALDVNFGGGVVTLPVGTGPDAAAAVAVQSDGKIVLAGTARSGNDDEVAVARWLLDDCGNGIVDVGEACDGGALIDGDCCSSACTILPAAASCRPSADACDIADFCDGASATCPDARLPDGDGDGVCDQQDLCPGESDPQQADGDGDGLGDACEPCTSGVAIGKPKMKMTNYLTAPGDDSFSLSGALDFANAPLLDPLARGARVLVEDGTGATLFDAAIPAGAYNPLTRTGWLVNGASTAFTFRTTQAVAGVIDKLKLSRTSARPDLVKVTMSGKRGAFATTAPVLPLTAIVVLDAPTAATGECGEVTFGPGPAPTPACSFNRSGSTLSCK